MLFGPSQTGKTTWARSLGSHIYFGSMFSGKQAFQQIDGAEYAIFDDWRGGLPCFPAYKDWLGCQWQVTVKQLHQDPRLVSWGRPCIWICNVDPRVMTHANDQTDWSWMAENVDFVEITDKLVTFHANTTQS